MMHFDDFHLGEVFGHFCSDFHHQDSPHGEVGANQDTHAVLFRQAFQFLQIFLGEAGGAHYGVDPGVQDDPQVVHDHIGPGKIHHHIGLAGFQGPDQVRIHRAAFHGFVLAELVHSTHQFHIFLLQDRLYHCVPHSAQGTVYQHFDHTKHLSFVHSFGRQKNRSWRRAQ